MGRISRLNAMGSSALQTSDARRVKQSKAVICVLRMILIDETIRAGGSWHKSIGSIAVDSSLGGGKAVAFEGYTLQFVWNQP